MYIDPSAGSLMLQIMAAGVLTLTASVSRVRESAKRLLLGLFRRKDR